MTAYYGTKDKNHFSAPLAFAKWSDTKEHDEICAIMAANRFSASELLSFVTALVVQVAADLQTEPENLDMREVTNAEAEMQTALGDLFDAVLDTKEG